MLARVLFGAFGFLFVLLALFVFPPAVLEIALALLCALATYELLGTTQIVKSRKVLTACILVSFWSGLCQTSYLQNHPLHDAFVMWAVIVLLLFSFGELLKRNDSVQATEVLSGFFGSLLLPYLLLSLTRIFQMPNGNLLILIPLLAAWGSDTFALFAGVLFGKHKLAPAISPKKTVEGAIGGIFGGVLCLIIFTALVNYFAGLHLSYIATAVLGAAGAVVGQFGDLSFSIIKRQTRIKDYGFIFPGHGGVLDRFDSVVFVAPVVEAVLLLFGA